jgi:hypothetical protein
MAGDAQLVFALRHGHLISIDEVGRGRQADCRCPACGASLIAKKGPEVSHHFAHEGGQSCEGAVETALHLLAKHLICSPGATLSLPVYEIMSKVKRGSEARVISEAVPGVGGKTCRVDRGRQEAQFDGFRADAVISVSSGSDSVRQMIVEIAVTNRCSKQKIRRIAATGIPAIEIDLRKFSQGASLSVAALQSHLLQPGSVKWLFHPHQVATRKRLAGRLMRYRAPFDVLKISGSSAGESGAQSVSDSGLAIRGSGLDALLERQCSKHGPPSLEDFREIQNQYFEHQKKRMRS